MSSEPTSVAPETVDASRGDVNKQPTDDIIKQSNGDDLTKPPAEDHALEEKKSTKDNAPAEGPKPADLSPAPGASEAHLSLGDEKKGETNAGDKREHEATTASTGPDKSSVPEPVPKKQKTHEEKTEAESPNGVEGPADPAAANGEKKPGRPKKTKETVRKAIPTDGVGSRTRSRTKAN